MGASIFSGLFDKNPDFFDGDAKETRSTKSVAAPDLYALLKELAYGTCKRQKEAADGAAATATAEHPFHVFDTYTKSLQNFQYLPAAALTADNANFATLIVRLRKADGSLANIVAQVTTQITGSGNWTAFKPVPVPLSDGTLALALNNAKLDGIKGWSLTLEITKTGTGVVVPAGSLQGFFK